MKQTKNKTGKEWGDGVFTLLSWFKTEKVKNAKVMVVGAGALGNEVLKNLALFGVGNIVVVDFDKIEYSNLTRSILFRPEDADKGLYKAEIAAKRLKEVNPEIHVQAVCGDLSTEVGLGVYRRMDVVVGCLDNVWARVLLNRLCFRAGKIWIDGGIGDLEGLVSGYQLDKNCYECSLSKREMKNKASCYIMWNLNEENGRLATTPVSASIIGAIQAQEAMKIIHEEELKSGAFSSLVGQMLNYGGKHPHAETYEFCSYKRGCVSHEYWENIVEIPELGADTKSGEALQIIKKALKVKSVEINLRNDRFVDYLASLSDNENFAAVLPESKIKASKEMEYLSVKDGGLFKELYENIDEKFPYLDLTLKQIGIPHFDVLQVTTEKGYKFVELSADKELYKELLQS